MMKKLILCLLISLGLWSCYQEKSTIFTIEGVIEGVKDSTEVSLYYLVENNGIWEKVTKTTYLINNKFRLEGNINELTAADLLCGETEISLYIEPTVMKLVIDKNNPYDYRLSGTSVEKESIELRNLLAVNLKMRDAAKDSIQKIFNQITLSNDEPMLVDSLMQKAEKIKMENAIKS